MGFRPLTVAAVILFWAMPASAQQSVTLQFSGGQVTLSAQDAPVRAILAEWARLGGATIVNGDQVVGPPVTLQLSGVPERQALDIVLRSAAGYMLAPRPAGSAGASAFDRILILPTSIAPRNPPPASAAGPRPAAPRPPVMPRPSEGTFEVPVDDSQEAASANGDPNPQPNQFPVPGAPRVMPPPFGRRPPIPAGTMPPGAGPIVDEDVQAETQPTQNGVAPTPANPFGVPFGSSATPGTVSPAPQQQGPNRVPTNRGQ